MASVLSTRHFTYVVKCWHTTITITEYLTIPASPFLAVFYMFLHFHRYGMFVKFTSVMAYAYVTAWHVAVNLFQ